jgi:hypothetical protein
MMQIYGFTYDNGEYCYLSEHEYREGVAGVRRQEGELPGFTAWEAEVPDEVLLDAAYEYISINEANGNNE